MKKILSIFTLLLVAGCSTAPAPTTTTTIDAAIDQDLIGEWTLESQELDASTGTVTNPFSGNTLTINADGTFNQDYSTEEATGPLGNTCSAEGAVTGTMTTDNPGQMHVTLDSMPEIEVTCPGSGAPATSSSATIPLGSGQGMGTPPDQYVLYSYEVNGNSLTLTQQNTITNVSTVYNYQK